MVSRPGVHSLTASPTLAPGLQRMRKRQRARIIKTTDADGDRVTVVGMPISTVYDEDDDPSTTFFVTQSTVDMGPSSLRKECMYENTLIGSF